MNFSKIFLLTFSFSSLLLSGFAVPSTDSLDVSILASPVGAPGPAPSAEGIHFSQSNDVVETADLEQLCKDVENPTLCAETILSHIKGPLDPVRALEIEINAVMNQTKHTIDMIVKSFSDPNTPKTLVDKLGVCKDNYENIVNHLSDAVASMEEHDLGKANVVLSAVITNQQTCEDTFKESPGFEWPFPQESQAILQLASNCLAMLEKIY